MRDLIVTENISLDGVLDGGFYLRAGEGADAGDVDDALRRQREAADTLLLGRKTFEAFREFWPKQTENPSGNAQYLNAVRKVVVSSTLDAHDLGWEHSEVVRSIDGVRALKEEVGRDIVATGSVSLVRSLLDARLVDEVRLFVYPSVVREGRTLFAGDVQHELSLVESTSFRSGVVLVRYRVGSAS